MNFQFANPWALYLLLLAPLAGLWWADMSRRRSEALGRFISPAMTKKLSPPFNKTAFLAQSVLVLSSIALSLLALARPRWGVREEKILLRSRDLVVAIDVSRSMLARDVRPSRLERAKIDVMDLLKALDGDRVGLLAFRRRAVPLCPLTADYAYLDFVLDTVGINSAPAGETNIGDAIVKAMDMFDSDSGAHRALILISDGEDLSGELKQAAEAAGQNGITIFTVGLGDPAGSRVPGSPDAVGYLEHDGEPVMSKLEHETLKFLAETTGGSYVPVGTGNVDLGRIYREHLSRVAAKDEEEIFRHSYVERYRIFLFPAALALLCAAMLSRGRPSVSPGKTARKAALACLLLSAADAGFSQTNQVQNAPAAGAPALSQPAATARREFPIIEADIQVPPGRAGARLAQSLYRKGDYERAAKAFMDSAADMPPAIGDKYLYNAACALFKAGRHADAAGIFDRLARNNSAGLPPASCLHNLGCALFESQRAAPEPAGPETNQVESAKNRVKTLERSAGAFQQAARANPAYDPTRENLAITAAALDEEREKLFMAELMAKYGAMPPHQLADQLLSRQRALPGRLAEAAQDKNPSKIQAFETLASEQKHNADMLGPLKNSLLSALSGAVQQAQDPQKAQQQLAQINSLLDALSLSMRDTSSRLRDLDQSASTGVESAEKGVYSLWKNIASHDMLLREDIAVQSNIVENIASPESGKNAEKQGEAASLTELFKLRFEEAFPETGQDQTPQPQPQVQAQEQQLDPETRKKILELTERAREEQAKAANSFSANDAAAARVPAGQALQLLREIQELLPKQQDQQQDQQNQQNQQQQQQDEQQNQDQQQQDEQQNRDQQQNQDQQQQEPEKQEERDAQPEKEEKQQAMTPEQAKELIEKARQREQEHAREKMLRQHVPLTPSARDW